MRNLNPSSPLIQLHELTVSAHTPFHINYPELFADQALCVGLSINWRYMSELHAFALQHTHAQEQARAARFLRAEDALRHLLGRALLRNLAIHYGSMVPDLAIPVNPWGKPEPALHAIGCNLSHAGNQIWAAVARFPHVGIDVESAAAPSDYRDIFLNFHPDEIAVLQTIPDASAAMMRCWSRKEAVSKAVGMGLSLSLRSYAVDCRTVSSEWLLTAPSPTLPSDWTTVDLPVGSNYVGALAIEGRCSHVIVLKLVCGA